MSSVQLIFCGLLSCTSVKRGENPSQNCFCVLKTGWQWSCHPEISWRVAVSFPPCIRAAHCTVIYLWKLLWMGMWCVGWVSVTSDSCQQPLWPEGLGSWLQWKFYFMFSAMKLLLGFPGACCSLVLLTTRGTHWPCLSLLSYLGFHSLMLTLQNAELNVLHKEIMCRSFKLCRRWIVLLSTWCPKSWWQLQAGVGSLDLSEMCGAIHPDFTSSWRGTARWNWSARQQSPMLFSFPPFSGHPQLSRTFQHPAATLGGCCRDELCAELSLTRAPAGSCALSLAADTRAGAWLPFRRQPAIPTQRLCKHSQPCRCLPAASNVTQRGSQSKKPFAVFSRSRSGCLHCHPCMNRLSFQLEGTRQAVQEECDLSELESSDLKHHCKYQNSLLVKWQTWVAFHCWVLFNLFPVPLENGELWISCSVLHSLCRWNQKNIF